VNLPLTYACQWYKNNCMRRNFIYLLAFISIYGCASVESLLDKGEYSRAFSLSLSKVRGAKKKETKYVSALEKSYAKLNEADRRKIEMWDAPRKPVHWEDVLFTLKGMADRQQKLEPLLPLKSATGYKANFEMYKYVEEIHEAEEQVCLYHFGRAAELVAQTRRTGQRTYAREAYDALKKVEALRPDFPGLSGRRDEARTEGTTIVYFNIHGLPGNMLQQAVMREIQSMPVSSLDRFWFNYSVDTRDKETADYQADVFLENLTISPERERIHTYTEKKEILITKDSKKEKRDSTDIIVEKEVIENVKADISEVFREKKAVLQGRLQIQQKTTGEMIANLPLEVFHEFNGYACKYSGDERALSQATRKKLDGYLEFFPTDYDMAVKLAVVFRDALLQKAGNANIQ
jgi:hypothetical protein